MRSGGITAISGIAIALCIFTTASANTTIVGSVGQIIDGDTFVLEQDAKDRSIRIDLWGIDAPELSQPYGEQARKALSKALSADQIRVVVVNEGEHDSRRGRVYVNGRSVNQWMVRSGNAWVDTRYNPYPQFMVMQHTAQNHLWGLWSLPATQQVRPIDYRQTRSER